LKIIDLRWNNLGVIGGKALADSMKTNSSITTLDVAGCDVPDEILTTIEMAILRNRNFNVSKASQKQESILWESQFSQLKKDHEKNLLAVSQRLEEKKDLLAVTHPNINNSREQKTKHPTVKINSNLY
jgi:hypothetical protein